MSTRSSEKTGVILMTYGSATTADKVQGYFERIYNGTASAALIADFENRYRLVGHSPLIDITNEQAAHTQTLLGESYIVRAGMRHSAPFIEEAVADCRDGGATTLIGIILSPQFSSFMMDGYTAAFREAALRHGLDETRIGVAGPWSTEPHFIQLLAGRVTGALEELNKQYATAVPLIFTTHSLPLRVVQKDPRYLEQLQATIDAVREKLQPNQAWYAGYQSAGHRPEAWLKPDVFDILQELYKKKTPAVLLAPIQFLTDHLEILYDLDIAARAQCESLGIHYKRIALPNTDPQFIKSLASVIQKSELLFRQ